MPGPFPEVFGQLRMSCLKQSVVQSKASVCAVVDCFGQLNDGSWPVTEFWVWTERVAKDMANQAHLSLLVGVPELRTNLRPAWTQADPCDCYRHITASLARCVVGLHSRGMKFCCSGQSISKSFCGINSCKILHRNFSPKIQSTVVCACEQT